MVLESKAPNEIIRPQNNSSQIDLKSSFKLMTKLGPVNTWFLVFRISKDLYLVIT